MKKVGIVDPWGEPKASAPLPPARPARVNPDQIDFDADLRAKGNYVFRGKHACIQIQNTEIGTAEDAVRDLSDAVIQLTRFPKWESELRNAGVGADADGVKFNAPDSTAFAIMKTSATYNPTSAVWFRGQTIDHGLLRLCRVLREVERSPEKKILQQLGITPMLK